MTDTIRRQDMTNAIEALSPTGVKPVGVELCANITIEQALAAINAVPAVTVTDDMVSSAIRVYVAYGKRGGTDMHEAMKAGLVEAITSGDIDLRYGPTHDLQVHPSYTVTTISVKSLADEYNTTSTWRGPRG